MTQLTYNFYHRHDFSDQLLKARQIAEYAISNKKNKKLLSSKYVKQFGLPSAISNQILRKYSRASIKKVSRANLIVPGQALDYNKETHILTIKPLKLSFKWYSGRDIVKVNQVELNHEKIFICVSFNECGDKVVTDDRVIGVDLNAGCGRHIAVCANLQDNSVISLCKQGPNVRKRFFKKRQRYQTQGDYETLKKVGDKEKRCTRNMDHIISRRIVDYAKEQKATIVLEDLKGIRQRTQKQGKGGAKALNRTIASWSFYRLQTYIMYKAEMCGVPCCKVPPHYTSQHCSYCGKIGKRDGKWFVCKAKSCHRKNVRRNADVNAAFCIAKRKLNLI